MRMYCKYCGRKIQEGEICNCRSQNDSVRESGSQKNKQESEQPKKQKERPKKEKQSQSKKNGSSQCFGVLVLILLDERMSYFR